MKVLSFKRSINKILKHKNIRRVLQMKHGSFVYCPQCNGTNIVPISQYSSLKADEGHLIKQMCTECGSLQAS
jgi:phage pi2 protein 07